jgi:hypothetical protein
MHRMVGLLVCAGAFLLGPTLPANAQTAEQTTDHATFDASNPGNLEPGALCKVLAPGNPPSQPWKFYANVSNNSNAVQNFQIFDRGGSGGFVRYFIAPNSTVFVTYPAGNTRSTTAFRLFAAQNSQLSGYVAAEGLKGALVSCIGCDNDDNGVAACDALIPAP